MRIGELFARALRLWRGNMGRLVLAGVVVAFITLGLIAGVTGAAYAAGGTLATTRGNGLLVSGVYGVALLLIEGVAITLYGGLFGMVIGAARADRGVALADLFRGFRHFASYALFALVVFVISLALGALNAIPVIGLFAGVAVGAGILVSWIYVLPLMADRRLGFREANRGSRALVRVAGWWQTFGLIAVPGLAVVAVVVVILLLAGAVSRGSLGVGLVVGWLLLFVFGALVPPFMTCYVSVMYLESDRQSAAVAAGAGAGRPPMAPRAGRARQRRS